MHHLCANLGCRSPLPPYQLRLPLKSRFGLCSGCHLVHDRFLLPTGGYVDGGTLKAVTEAVLQRQQLTKYQTAKAEQAMRPKAYPIGAWEDRPLYRMAVLMHRNALGRRQHILMGKRKRPTVQTITAAFVHYILGREVLGTGHHYNRYLAGAQFYQRRGVMAPAGRNPEVLTGDSRSTLYRLSRTDYTGLGSQILSAAEKHLGLSTADRDLTAFIVVAYHRKRLHPPITLPRRAMRTARSGDHPFDHRIPESLAIPRRYWMTIRRSSGLIDGRWPTSLDPVDPFAPAQPKAARPVAPPPPSPDWIFNPQPRP